MKHFWVITVLLAAAISGRAQQQYYTNPVLHMDYSDPDVCRVGEDYWMTASSFNCFPGLPVLHSCDLVHWTLCNYALTSYDQPLKPGEGVWAPAIRFHDGWFYIFVGDPDRGIFMVRTQDPKQKWEEPVWLVRGKGFIDPCPLWDDDGNAWLSHALAGSRAGLKSVVLVAPMAPDGTRLLAPSRIVYDGHDTQPTIEGTKFYKHGGKYYIFAPAGGVATGWQTVLRSASPLGPWEERIVLAEARTGINGPHQGAWVQTPDGQDWFLHFQDKGAYGRIVHLQPMKWTDDGWPLIGEDTGKGYGRPVRRQPAPFSTEAPTDEAGVPGPYSLPLAWQYPSVPLPSWHYALPDGGIRLYSVPQNSGSHNLWDCPNLIQQKFTAERFIVTAKLTFRPNPGIPESAGFVVMGQDYAGLKLSYTESGALLEQIICTDAHKGSPELCVPLATLGWNTVPQYFPLASESVPAVKYPDLMEASVWVKLEVAPKAVKGNVPSAICRFSYSLDGKRYLPAGQPFTAKPGRWIGAKWGFFCNRSGVLNDGGRLDITDLAVSNQ